jgi:hypothetical protein
VNPRSFSPVRSLHRSGRFLGRVAALVVLLVASAAVAQSGFRVTHKVANTAATHVEITGVVMNETRAEAVDVSVTVEAIGAGGKSAARGIAYVTSRLPAGAAANFSAKVPAVPGVTGYRAAVSSFRFVQSVEGP